VLNFVEGYGARFNVEERVQAYTHPLWFLLVTVFTLIVAHPVHAAWIVSAVCIVATYAIVWRFVLDDWVLFAVFVALCLASKSVSDFANSGLENPLSHLAIAIVFALAVRRRADAPSTLLMIVCSGTYLIRPDLVVLVAPLVSLHVWKLPNIYLRLRAMLAFAILPALWTGLSLVYYGFPFPNTAYAKLYVAIDPLQKFAQGSWYFIDSLNRDPITLVTITTGVVLGILGSVERRALALGIVLYAVFLASVGGDFMSGRLLSAPFIASLLLLLAFVRTSRSRPQAFALAILATISINAFARANDGWIWSQKQTAMFHGIADERATLKGFSFWDGIPGVFDLPPWTIRERSVVSICGGLGIVGLKLGPSVHVIDQCALADPLLARLPPKFNEAWRPGHFERQLPTDYFRAVRTGLPNLPDSETSELYAQVSRVTRLPLLAPERLEAMYLLNSRQRWLTKAGEENYRFTPIPRTTIIPEKTSEQIHTGGRCTAWDAESHLFFETEAVIALARPTVSGAPASRSRRG
jgi:arabinofuranosyltransferase